MRRTPFPQLRRRNRLVIPRMQGGVAALVGAVVLVAGGVSAVFLYRDARRALWVASYGGHYGFPTPFDVMKDVVLIHLLVLSAVVFAGGSFVFLWRMRRIREGIRRLAGAFEASTRGELSSPTDAGGLGEMADAVEEVDEVRSHTLSLIRQVREAVEEMQTASLTEEEFARRWVTLKEKIGRIVP